MVAVGTSPERPGQPGRSSHSGKMSYRQMSADEIQLRYKWSPTPNETLWPALLGSPGNRGILWRGAPLCPVHGVPPAIVPAMETWSRSDSWPPIAHRPATCWGGPTWANTTGPGLGLLCGQWGAWGACVRTSKGHMTSSKQSDSLPHTMDPVWILRLGVVDC